MSSRHQPRVDFRVGDEWAFHADLQPKPPNSEGSTLSTVRWLVELPNGMWLGAWDKGAFAAYLAASPQPHKGAWMPIETAPENMTKYVVVRWIDREGVEHHDFDYTEDGCWMKWHDHAEHVEMIGGHGVSYTPPYLHFLQLPEPPGIPKESEHG